MKVERIVGPGFPGWNGAAGLLCRHCSTASHGICTYKHDSSSSWCAVSLFTWCMQVPGAGAEQHDQSRPRSQPDWFLQQPQALQRRDHTCHGAARRRGASRHAQAGQALECAGAALQRVRCRALQGVLLVWPSGNPASCNLSRLHMLHITCTAVVFRTAGAALFWKLVQWPVKSGLVNMRATLYRGASGSCTCASLPNQLQCAPAQPC